MRIFKIEMSEVWIINYRNLNLNQRKGELCNNLRLKMLLPHFMCHKKGLFSLNAKIGTVFVPANLHFVFLQGSELAQATVMLILILFVN